MSSIVGERHFGRHFKRLFGRGLLRVKNCRETVGSQFLPRGIKMSRKALWAFMFLWGGMRDMIEAIPGKFQVEPPKAFGEESLKIGRWIGTVMFRRKRDNGKKD